MVKNNPRDTSVKSFQEVYETSYSHGLESIYRIENIDLRTIKVLGSKPDITPVEPKTTPGEPILGDGELDLGPEIIGYVDSFVLKEPIQSLKLSKHTERCLVDHEIKTLGELKSTDLNQLVFVKGIGQGHIVEVKEKLQDYLNNKPLEKARSIDFSSWIRALVGDLEAKSAYILLEPYGLSHEITLSPLESVELKKLTLERKRELTALAKTKITSPDRVKEARYRLEEIERVFVKPWISARQGVATGTEVVERLKKVAENPQLALPALQFIKDNYTEGALFHLPQIVFNSATKGLLQADLIFADIARWGEFCSVETALLSYLWAPGAAVLYEDLIRWISSDFLKNWKGLEEAFVYKVLSLSPKISRKKLLSGELLIKSRYDYIRN